MIAEFFGTVITWFIMVPIYVVIVSLYVILFVIGTGSLYIFDRIVTYFKK